MDYPDELARRDFRSASIAELRQAVLQGLQDVQTAEGVLESAQPGEEFSLRHRVMMEQIRLMRAEAWLRHRELLDALARR